MAPEPRSRRRPAVFLPLVALTVLGAAACAKGSRPGGRGGVSFGARAVPHSTATGAPQQICARFSLQPYALDARGEATLAGAPAIFTSATAPGPPGSILGCIDDPAIPGDDWGYYVTADSFNDCATTPAGGNAIAGLSPKVVSTSISMDCLAGLDVPLDVTVDVYLVQPSQGGYVDLSLGIDVNRELVGCKNAEIVAGVLRFGEIGGYAASGGAVPFGFTAIGLTGPDGLDVPLASDVVQQFSGIMLTGEGTNGAFYTGLLPIAQPGTWSVLQTFAQVCGPGEAWVGTQVPQCDTLVQPGASPAVSTVARLADAFAVVPGQAGASGPRWVSATVSSETSIDLGSGTGAQLSDPTADALPSWNPATLRQRLSFAEPVAGLYLDRQRAGALLVVLSTPAGPAFDEVALDAASGRWQALGAPVALTSLSAAQLAARGIFEKVSGACAPLPAP